MAGGDPLRRELGMSLRCWWCDRMTDREELHKLDGARLMGVECRLPDAFVVRNGAVKICTECAILFAELRARHDVEAFEHGRA